MTDATLVRRYVSERDERAFAALVQRHVKLVYFAALRQLDGDSGLAEDVTQAVFTDLARKAATLVDRAALEPWLFTSTRFAASKARRTEIRRRAREQEAFAMQAIDQAGDDASRQWEKLRPVLDDALAALDSRDREAVLLRFFGGRAFAEIGRALHLSDEAARKRVDRALEKLAATLARRGVTSTAAALAVVMTQHASANAPAGLATTVAASALAGAAGAGALTVGSAWTSLLTAAKSSGVAIALVALACSVGVNAHQWLSLQSSSASVSAAGAAQPSVARAPLPESPFAVLATEDAAALRDRLRAAGASEAATRAMVEGVLRRRYREKLSADRAERQQDGWWRDRSSWPPNRAGDAPVFVEDQPLLREMVFDPLEQLFGPDPLEIAEQEAKFEFLPEAKRLAFIDLETHYAAALARLSDAEKSSPVGAQLTREREERRGELRAALTSAERAEYDLRFSTLALAQRERMSQIAASESEYRTIMSVLGGERDHAPGAQRAAFNWEREHALLQQIVGALGYERGLDFAWSGAFEYPSYAQAAQDAGLPPNTAGRVLQLAAQSIERAFAIHGDVALTPAERRAAVIALQDDVRPQLDALLPPDVQARVAPMAMAWLTALGDGRYKRIFTTATGNVGGVISPSAISVETPLSPEAARTSSQFVARRAAGP